MNATIEDYMATDLVTFSPEEDIVRAMRILLETRYSGAPVLDRDGQLVGVLSKKDCLAIVYNTAYHQDWGGRVEQYMSRKVETIDAASSILEAAEKFLNSSFRRFPVVRDGRLVGQISRFDILRAIDERYLREGRQAPQDNSNR
ncbi:MAG: CBS domain-containing protein [Gammaproteobacteria bacterium]|nr:CBS domain-containing protein [Gammaproteobacteria bacterium]MDH3449145.1 CBS domain-containing protein [Gammaproteobacteria bacterium]